MFLPVANSTTSAISSSPWSVTALMPCSVLINQNIKFIGLAELTTRTLIFEKNYFIIINQSQKKTKRNTFVKFVLGCRLIPLPSRFLATTALISSSKPLQQNLFTNNMFGQRAKQRREGEGITICKLHLYQSLKFSITERGLKGELFSLLYPRIHLLFPSKVGGLAVKAVTNFYFKIL